MRLVSRFAFLFAAFAPALALGGVNTSPKTPAQLGISAEGCTGGNETAAIQMDGESGAWYNQAAIQGVVNSVGTTTTITVKATWAPTEFGSYVPVMDCSADPCVVDERTYPFSADGFSSLWKIPGYPWVKFKFTCTGTGTFSPTVVRSKQ